MKATKITYWITTGLVSGGMLLASYSYFADPHIPEAFVHLGFPDWFRVELGLAKFLGLVALILPMIPARVKEWAYAGFFINFVNAFLAHLISGDPVSAWIAPLVLLVMLITSYVTFHKLKSANGEKN